MLATLLAWAIAAGSAGAEALRPGRAVAVAGAVLTLEDGRRVGLAGVVTPDRAAVEARLARLTVGQGLRFAPAGSPIADRYGRLRAQIWRIDDGRWLQGTLVADGLALVAGGADMRAGLGALLCLEARARAAGRGVWSGAGVVPTAAAARALGRFAVLEGRILSARRIDATVYLNFGADWRRDFTAILDAAARRRFRDAGRDPLAMEGRRVRLRGLVYRRNGPAVDLELPEWLELLDGAPLAPGCAADAHSLIPSPRRQP